MGQPAGGQSADIAGNDCPRIDCHVHIFDDRMPTCPTAWTVPDYGFSAQDLLATMERHGVGYGVISGLSISGGYNDYMIRALRQHRNLRGTAIVDPPADLYTLERMAEDGIVGIRLQFARMENLPDLDSFAYRQLLRRVRDLGWHVQVAIEGPQLPLLLDPLLASGVDIVIDHFGHPDPGDRLGCAGFAAMLRAVDRGRCWVKMSGGFRLPGTAAWREDPDGDLESLAQEIAAGLIASVGTDRLLWGSDAPFVGYEKRLSYEAALASFQRWVPDPTMRREICGTGMKLYFDQ